METLRSGSSGPLVELLQSVLKKRGIFSGTIDGAFGSQTNNAVTAFQQRSGLIADGIVGSSTWSALAPYINGFEVHTVAPGDTLFNLAARYSSGLNRIASANPGIDVYNLQVGQKLNIPFGSVVPTDISYSYDILSINLSAFRTLFPFLEIGYIGNSELCKRIPYIRIGTGAKKVFYNASFHANEWITTPVLMKFIENFANAYISGSNIYSYSAASVYGAASIYIVPMVNPDGLGFILDKDNCLPLGAIFNKIALFYMLIIV